MTIRYWSGILPLKEFVEDIDGLDAGEMQAEEQAYLSKIDKLKQDLRSKNTKTARKQNIMAKKIELKRLET